MARLKKDNKLRKAVALTLRHELGFDNTQIGRYLGLHKTNVAKVITGTYDK